MQQSVTPPAVSSSVHPQELELVDPDNAEKKPQRRRSKYSHLDDRTRKRIIKDNKNQRAMRQRRELGESFEDLAELLGYDCNGIDAPDRPELMLMALQRIADLRRQIAQGQGESTTTETLSMSVPKIEQGLPPSAPSSVRCVTSVTGSVDRPDASECETPSIHVKEEDGPLSVAQTDASAAEAIQNCASLSLPPLIARRMTDPPSAATETISLSDRRGSTAASFLAIHGIPSFSLNTGNTGRNNCQTLSSSVTVSRGRSCSSANGAVGIGSSPVCTANSNGNGTAMINVGDQSNNHRASKTYLTTRKPITYFNQDTLKDLAMITSCDLLPPPPAEDNPTTMEIPALQPMSDDVRRQRVMITADDLTAASVDTASSPTSPSPGRDGLKSDD